MFQFQPVGLSLSGIVCPGDRFFRNITCHRIHALLELEQVWVVSLLQVELQHMLSVGFESSYPC